MNRAEIKVLEETIARLRRIVAMDDALFDRTLRELESASGLSKTGIASWLRDARAINAAKEGR